MQTPDPRLEAQHEGKRRLSLARANAIENYTYLEQALCNLFAHLLGTESDKAAVVFFRLNNSRSRNHILGRLLKKTHGKEYNAFWKSFVRLVRTIDQERNEIVHWQVAGEIGHAPPENFLIPPNIWDFRKSSPKKTAPDLETFSRKADFCARLINTFTLLLNGTLAKFHAIDGFAEIFVQEVTYPPPEKHPLK